MTSRVDELARYPKRFPTVQFTGPAGAGMAQTLSDQFLYTNPWAAITPEGSVYQPLAWQGVGSIVDDFRSRVHMQYPSSRPPEELTNWEDIVHWSAGLKHAGEWKVPSDWYPHGAEGLARPGRAEYWSQITSMAEENFAGNYEQYLHYGAGVPKREGEATAEREKSFQRQFAPGYSGQYSGMGFGSKPQPRRGSGGPQRKTRLLETV